MRPINRERESEPYVQVMGLVVTLVGLIFMTVGLFSTLQFSQRPAENRSAIPGVR
ncbi:MAG TPA: hypothetical protein VGR13_05455 [Actinomycetota bacterium]|jgi:hypothetical protein|nr:hypothetical protein [Actinomycetota bacterium]